MLTDEPVTVESCLHLKLTRGIDQNYRKTEDCHTTFPMHTVTVILFLSCMNT